MFFIEDPCDLMKNGCWWIVPVICSDGLSCLSCLSCLDTMDLQKNLKINGEFPDDRWTEEVPPQIGPQSRTF